MMAMGFEILFFLLSPVEIHESSELMRTKNLFSQFRSFPCNIRIWRLTEFLRDNLGTTEMR